MEEKIAKQVIDLALESTASLNSSVHLIKDNCSEEEFFKFRRAAGCSIVKIMEDILEPIYKEHPNLKPY